MGSASRPAMSAEQFYVSVSRGRERANIYTDLSPVTLRAAIHAAGGTGSGWETTSAIMHVEPAELPERPRASA